MSHLELGFEHCMLSVAGIPSFTACMQKYVPFIDSIFCGVSSPLPVSRPNGSMSK